MENNQRRLFSLILVLCAVLLVAGGFFLNKNQLIQFLTTSSTSQISSEDIPAQVFRPLGGFNTYGDLASRYMVDGVYAYYDGRRTDADPATLDVVKGSLKDIKGYITYGYARDAHSVYYEGVPLTGVNPATFQPIENGSGSHSYGTDGQTVYFYSNPIREADIKTFEVLWQNSWEGCPHTHYSKDATRVYFDASISRSSSVVSGADAATFKSLINGFGKDKRGYYKGAEFMGPTISENELFCSAG